MSCFGTIYADPDISHTARTVYMYLKVRSDAQGKCWPAVTAQHLTRPRFLQLRLLGSLIAE